MVQKNSLARNLALQISFDAPGEFGDTFTYTKVYFGKIDGEVITQEKYLDGNFVKHINNTGEIFTKTELGMKCEAFVHYTYASTKQQQMVVDIQGVGFQLCDPEIVSHHEGWNKFYFILHRQLVYACN